MKYWNQFRFHKTNQWISFHPQVITLYNNSIQSTTRYKPNELHFSSNADDLKSALTKIKTRAKRPGLTHNIQRFFVGDYVRVPTNSLPENRRNQFADPIAKWSKPLRILAVNKPRSPFESYRYYLDVRETYPQYLLMRTEKPTIIPPVVPLAQFVPRVEPHVLGLRRSERVSKPNQNPDYVY